MHLVTVLCTRRGHVTTSLTRPEPEKAPEADTSSLWASKYLPHLWKTFFHSQNITADLHDYWNCHELLDLRTYFYNFTSRRSHLHTAQPSQSVKADWTSPRFDLKTRSLNFAKLMFEMLHSYTQPQHLSSYSSSPSNAWQGAAFLVQTRPFSPTLHTYSGHENQAPILHPWSFYSFIGTWRLGNSSLRV